MTAARATSRTTAGGGEPEACDGDPALGHVDFATAPDAAFVTVQLRHST